MKHIITLLAVLTLSVSTAQEWIGATKFALQRGYTDEGFSPKSSQDGKAITLSKQGTFMKDEATGNYFYGPALLTSVKFRFTDEGKAYGKNADYIFMDSDRAIKAFNDLLDEGVARFGEPNAEFDGAVIPGAEIRLNYGWRLKDRDIKVQFWSLQGEKDLIFGATVSTVALGYRYTNLLDAKESDPNLRELTDMVLSLGGNISKFNSNFKQDILTAVMSAAYHDQNNPMSYIGAFAFTGSAYGIDLKFPNEPKITYTALPKNVLAVAKAYGNDCVVELLIDSNKWEKATLIDKMYVMYHELGHDLLNFDHDQGIRLMATNKVKVTPKELGVMIHEMFDRARHGRFKQQQCN